MERPEHRALERPAELAVSDPIELEYHLAADECERQGRERQRHAAESDRRQGDEHSKEHGRNDGAHEREQPREVVARDECPSEQTGPGDEGRLSQADHAPDSSNDGEGQEDEAEDEAARRYTEPETPEQRVDAI